MRKLNAILLVSFCLGAGRASAQQLFGTLHGGVAKSHIVSSTSPDLDASPRYAITIGAGLRLMLIGPVGIQAEAVYVEKGRPDLHLNYWEFPVLARVEAPVRIFGLSPAVAAGIAPARLAHCAFWEVPAAGYTVQSASAAPSPVRVPCSTMITNVDDFGVVAVLELTRELRRGRIGIQLRFTQGTSNITSGYDVSPDLGQVSIGGSVRFGPSPGV